MSFEQVTHFSINFSIITLTIIPFILDCIRTKLLLSKTTRKTTMRYKKFLKKRNIPLNEVIKTGKKISCKTTERLYWN